MTKPALPIWQLPADAVLAQLDTQRQGLAEGVARARLQQVGPNKLTEKPPRSRWLLFFDQFRNGLIAVLAGAAVLSGVIGDLHDAVVILVVIVVNAVLGYVQEARAEKSLLALRKMLTTRVKVRRNDSLREVAAEDVVPGDIVLLEAGDKVPADGRLLQAHSLEVDEAFLTGESQAVSKHAEAITATELPLADRANLLFMHSVITRGRAELVVSATGMATEMGRIAGLLAAAEDAATPLQLQLDALGQKLTLIAGAVVVLIFALGLWHRQPLVDMLLTSIALAVAAIPEGLPAVVTITLAVGMHRMARQRAILKKLAAVETLGCTTVICTDKTGTLTLNQMTARAFILRAEHYRVSGPGNTAQGSITVEGRQVDTSRVLELTLPLVLCNDSRLDGDQLIGDPTEAALLVLAAKSGLNLDEARASAPRLAELPFSSDNKFMVTAHELGNDIVLYAKGAPDVLLARSTRHLTAAGEEPLTDDARAAWLADNAQLADQALRVLAVACRTVSRRRFAAANGDLATLVDDLTVVGLVGLIDPPRPEAAAAIALCRQAGIAVKMVTGDHPVTAAAIARELGLGGDVLAGVVLDRMTDAELTDKLQTVAVFARVAPEHKVRLVQMLQAQGEVVAMTGDGVNDAPALKNADIGVAMGISGTEVAKQAATMVLTDDNFATIVNAVREGRTLYDNIIKFVRFQLSTNVGAIATVLAASLLGLPAPFTALQLLWINIIMDGPPAMTLGVDPARPDIMRQPPRLKAAPILTLARFFRLLVYGLTMMVGTLGSYWYAHAATPEVPHDRHALTLAFTTFVLFQCFNVFNARAEFGSAFNRDFFRNAKLWAAVLSVAALQALVVHWSVAQNLFKTVDLSLLDWSLAVTIAASVLVLDELRKLAWRGWQLIHRDDAAKG